MTELEIFHSLIGKGVDAIKEAEKLKLEINHLNTTHAATVKGLSDELNRANNTIKTLEAEKKTLTERIAVLEKPVPPVVPVPEKPTATIPDKNKVDYVDKPIKLTASMADAKGEIRITGKRIKSLDSGVHCIDYSALGANHKVIIENCIFLQRGMAIFGEYSPAELTVRNCIGFGDRVKAGTKASWGYWFVRCNNPRFATLENNHVEDIGGFKIEYATDTTGCRGYNIRYNTARNIWQGDLLMNFINIKGTKGSTVPGQLIEWNFVLNEPGKSNLEDTVNVFEQRAPADSPAIIRHNFIDGAYCDINATRYTGGGIILDGKNLPVNHMTANWIIEENQVKSTLNYGIGIAAAINSTIRNNRVVDAATYPDGTPYKSWTSGIWADEYTDTKNLTSGNRIEGNYIAVKNAPLGLYNNSKPHTTERSNTTVTSVTRSMEDAEYTIWHKKLADNKITLGPKI